MPAFTFKTMIIPDTGPPENALKYGSAKDQNRMAEFFRPDMPVDRLVGILPEALRRHPGARRSSHPILSFTGIGVDRALEAQSLRKPLEPIGVLAEMRGWVLLLGVDQTGNTSIHYAESRAGRSGFLRWALTPSGIVACPGFPGCSDGFNALNHRLEGVTRCIKLRETQIQAIPLIDLLDITELWIKTDPLALLCQRLDCERCNAYQQKIKTRM
jgi:aminoglycoside 3-N-acetyltransferase